MDTLSRFLLLLGVGFLIANLRLLMQFVAFLKLRSSALLTWPGRKPPFYRLLLAHRRGAGAADRLQAGRC